MNVAVIIPAWNEEKTIEDTLSEYIDVFPDARIVVVDNNSTDGTNELAARVLRPTQDLLLVETRQGKGFGVKAAVSRVDADVYIMTDADGTYPASHAREMLQTLLARRADMIVGDRISGGHYDKQNTRLGHGFGNRLLTVTVSRLAGQQFNDVLSGLRVMSRPFVTNLDIRSEGFQLETELNVIAAYLRADVVEMPINYRERGNGSTSKLNTVRDGMRIMWFAVTHWLAFAPLQPFTGFAALAMLGSLLLTMKIISGFVLHSWPSTTTAVAAAALAMSGLLALFFGMTLRILGRNDRRRDIAAFLERKRVWNRLLDND